MLQYDEYIGELEESSFHSLEETESDEMGVYRDTVISGI